VDREFSLRKQNRPKIKERTRGNSQISWRIYRYKRAVQSKRWCQIRSSNSNLNSSRLVFTSKGFEDGIVDRSTEFYVLVKTTLQAKPLLFLLYQGEKKEPVPESRQAFEVAAAQTSELVNLVFSHQTGFSRDSIRLLNMTDGPITEPAVPRAQLLGLGSKL